MAFRISGLDPAPFRHLYGLSDEALAAHGAVRRVADATPGFPDRAGLRELDPGETALLVNHVHQPAATPYRASHAVFVREGAEAAVAFVDEVPDSLRRRTLSLRGFDQGGMMIDAAVIDGGRAEDAIDSLLANPTIAYVHAHYAAHGCYAALIERA